MIQFHLCLLTEWVAIIFKTNQLNVHSRASTETILICTFTLFLVCIQDGQLPLFKKIVTLKIKNSHLILLRVIFLMNEKEEIVFRSLC